MPLCLPPAVVAIDLCSSTLFPRLPSSLQTSADTDPYIWGQVVVGPPGAGKSTYCAGMQQFLTLAGRRCAVVNLDPANDPTGYTPAVDISELVSLEVVQVPGGRAGCVACCMAEELREPRRRRSVAAVWPQ